MLADPIQIGSLKLNNRIVKASMVENMATEQGEVTDRLIRFYQRQAKGGAGLLITGGAYVQKNGRSVTYLIGAYDDSLVEGLGALANAVHENGGKIALQIYHCGRQTRPELAEGDVVGPSAIPDQMTKVMPRPMTEDEIEETIQAFGLAARRVKEAGYDGVEVMAGHGYLISQFLSRRTNQRTDQWGGSLENRARFLFSVIERVRSEIGPDFPLLVKHNTEDRLKNGLTVEESAWVAQRLPEYGADTIKLSGGTAESALNISRGELPAEEILEEFSGWQRFKNKMLIRAMKNKFKFSEAYFLENVKQIKPQISVPVTLVGGLRTPEVMEQILKDGHADLIAIGRPLVRDPYLPQKILSGDPSPASCLNCNRCAIRIAQQRPLRCYASEKTNDEEGDS
ncbi:MAG: NADH:flavin oxidoreductase [Deltaproteobacteria bacterium]|nr:NADH:flavin oxidoreductase [Deltaproteobacteria bacterium]